jgi:hypothetical protein
MNNSTNEHEDKQIEKLFKSLERNLDDTYFAKNVMRKIKKRIWMRRLILVIAAFTGILVSFKPLFHYLMLLNDRLYTEYAYFNEGVWIDLIQEPIVIIFLMSIYFLIIKLAED